MEFFRRLALTAQSDRSRAVPLTARRFEQGDAQAVPDRQAPDREQPAAAAQAGGGVKHDPLPVVPARSHRPVALRDVAEPHLAPPTCPVTDIARTATPRSPYVDPPVRGAPNQAAAPVPQPRPPIDETRLVAAVTAPRSRVEAPVPPRSQRRGAAGTDATPVIHVTIDRLDIQAPPAPVPSKPRAGRTGPASTSLRDYLRQTRPGGSR